MLNRRARRARESVRRRDEGGGKKEREKERKMETRYFKKPSKALTHPEWTKTKYDPDKRMQVPTEELFEFTFDAWANLVLSDPWWMGDDSANENDNVARVDSLVRIRAALDDAGPCALGRVVAMESGDLKWFCDRARAIAPKMQGGPGLCAPAITTDFYLPVLKAGKTNPEPKEPAPAEAQATA